MPPTVGRDAEINVGVGASWGVGGYVVGITGSMAYVSQNPSVSSGRIELLAFREVYVYITQAFCEGGLLRDRIYYGSTGEPAAFTYQYPRSASLEADVTLTGTESLHESCDPSSSVTNTLPLGSEAVHVVASFGATGAPVIRHEGSALFTDQFAAGYGSLTSTGAFNLGDLGASVDGFLNYGVEGGTCRTSPGWPSPCSPIAGS